MSAAALVDGALAARRAAIATAGSLRCREAVPRLMERAQRASQSEAIDSAGRLALVELDDAAGKLGMADDPAGRVSLGEDGA